MAKSENDARANEKPFYFESDGKTVLNQKAVEMLGIITGARELEIGAYFAAKDAKKQDSYAVMKGQQDGEMKDKWTIVPKHGGSAQESKVFSERPSRGNHARVEGNASGTEYKII